MQKGEVFGGYIIFSKIAMKEVLVQELQVEWVECIVLFMEFQDEFDINYSYQYQIVGQDNIRWY